MKEEDFDKTRIISYWLNSANDDCETMLEMFKSKKYSWSLFIGHLMIEKLLKAYYVQQKDEYPPYIHNLIRLAERADLVITESHKKDFAVITAFNISVRYDDYKLSFQKQCTFEFTDQWINKLKEYRTWIIQQIKL